MEAQHQSPGNRDAEYLVSLCAVMDNDLPLMESFLREAQKLLAARYRYYEVVIIDNHSTDGSPEKVRELQNEIPNIRMIRLARPYHREIAGSAALDNAIGDYVVTLDLRHDPLAVAPEIVERMGAGADVVLGRCTNCREPWLRRTVLAAGRRIGGKILGVQIKPDTRSLFGFSRRAVNAITQIHSRSRYLRFDSALVAYQPKFLEYERSSRPGARSSQEPLLAAIASRLEVLVSHSAMPLRLASLLGVLAGCLNLLYLGYILVVVIVKAQIVEGWLTTSLTSTTMFLMLFIILAILTEYVARILDETKDRPLYFIEQESSSTVCSFDRERLNVV